MTLPWIDYFDGNATENRIPKSLTHYESRKNENRKVFLRDSDRACFLQMLEGYYDRYGIVRCQQR